MNSGYVENQLALSFVVLWRLKNYYFGFFFFQWIFNTKYIPGVFTSHRPCLCIMSKFSSVWEPQISESLLASNRKQTNKQKTGDIGHSSSWSGWLETRTVMQTTVCVYPTARHSGQLNVILCSAYKLNW